MRVYHFLEKHWAIESLIYERLKISQFSDMNDPFELLGVSLKKKSDRLDFYQLKKEVSEEMGAICFSKKWSNPVLWTHYGERHKGIALGFDIPTDHAHKVSYTGDRLGQDLIDELEKNDSDTNLAHKILTTKYKHWSYEDEIRMLVKFQDSNNEDGMYFLPYCKGLELREIIIGPRRNLTKENLLKIIHKDRSGIKITKSRLAFQSYHVVKDKSVKLA